MVNRTIELLDEDRWNGKEIPVMELAHELNSADLSDISGIKIFPDSNQENIKIIISGDEKNDYENTSLVVTKNGLLHIVSDLDRYDHGIRVVENAIYQTVKDIMDKEVAIDERINNAPVVAGINMDTLAWYAVKSLENIRDRHDFFDYLTEDVTVFSTTFKDAYHDDIFTISAGVKDTQYEDPEPYLRIDYSEKYGGHGFGIHGDNLNTTLNLVQRGEWYKDNKVKLLLNESLKIYDAIYRFPYVYTENSIDLEANNVNINEAPISSSYEFENKDGKVSVDINDIAKEYVHSFYGKSIESNIEISTAEVSKRYINKAMENGLKMEQLTNENKKLDIILSNIIKESDAQDKNSVSEHNENSFLEFNSEKEKIIRDYKDKEAEIKEAINSLNEKKPENYEEAIKQKERELKLLKTETNILINDKLSKASDYVKAVELFKTNMDKFMHSMTELAQNCVTIPKDFIVILVGNIYKDTIVPLISSGLNLCKKAAELGINGIASIDEMRKTSFELVKATQAIMDWNKNQAQTLEEIICNRIDDYALKADMNNQCDVSNFDARMRNRSMNYDELRTGYNNLLEYKIKVDDGRSDISEMDRMKYDGVYGDTVKSRMYFIQNVSNDLKIYLNDTFSGKQGLSKTDIDEVHSELNKIITNNLNKTLDGSDGKLIKDFMPDIFESNDFLGHFTKDIIGSIPIITGRLEANRTLLDEVTDINNKSQQHIDDIDKKIDHIKATFNVDVDDSSNR